MAAAATAVKFHVRKSRLQDAAVGLQERRWVQEAMGDLAKRGNKLLLDVIASTKAFNNGQSLGVATLGSSGLLLSSQQTKFAAGLVPNDPEEALVAHLTARRDHASSKVKLQLVHAQTAPSDSAGVSYSAEEVGAAKAGWRSPLVHSMDEEDYGWETDPNGGWLSSFP